jgi:hypothetical protein
MKRIFIILIIGSAILTAAHAQTDKPLKQGMPNTVMLSNGEVTYDLTGKWDAIYDIREFGTFEDVVDITQEGAKFVGIKLIGSPYVGKGSETIKGELEGDAFKSVSVYIMVDGWTPSKGEISNQGDRMVIEVPSVLDVTLTRK